MSIGGGLERAARSAAAIGCETMQIFSSNPRSWRSAPIDSVVVAEFRAMAAKKDLWPIILHTPYLVNLAAPDDEILRRSRESVAVALERAKAIGARFVVTHVGAHKGAGLDLGISRVVESLRVILGSVENDALLLLENTPGSGSKIGRSFEELRDILDSLLQHQSRLGICLDTAHLWGAGFDISTSGGVDRTLRDFASQISISRLHVIHANDSSTKLGSHRDVHQPAGKGQIGMEAFDALVNHPLLQGLPFIAETPTQEPVAAAQELERLRSLVRSSG